MQENFAILANKIYTPERCVSQGFVLVKSGRIIQIADEESRKSLADVKILDFSDYLLVPGFIDMHVHGLKGACTTDANPNSIEVMSKTLAQHGVTSFLPTLPMREPNLLTRSMEVLASFRDRKLPGAKILGIYLEGPFVSPEKPGAMEKEYFKLPSISAFEEVYEASKGMLRVMTLAPELPGAISIIKYAQSKGVRVSLGHTNASYEDAKAAIQAGATHVTHLFNAMRLFHHRDPGIVGAVLEDPNVSIELIGDLVHVGSTAVRLVYKIKPKNKIISITDGVAADLPEGIHELGGRKILVKRDAAYLPDGKTLAGGILTLDKVLNRLVFDAGLPFEDVLRSMTINPASVLDEEYIGGIEVGARADLVVLDQHLNVVATFIDGNLVYQRD